MKNIGQAQDAQFHYDYVLTRDPRHIQAHIGKAQACLMLGDYVQGFKELEWRLGAPFAYTQELVKNGMKWSHLLEEVRAALISLATTHE